MLDAIPTIAITLSVASLIVSILSFSRDRARIIAWCEVESHHNTSTPDGIVLALRIRIVNLGRRPAVLLHLAIHGSTQTWLETISSPSFSHETQASAHKAIEVIQEHSLAQNSAVRLLEGDAIDIVFWPDDSYSLYFTQSNPMDTAKKLYVLDCLGRKHRVRGDTIGLRKFFLSKMKTDLFAGN